jgi:ribosomal protein L11 methyltransferase
MHYKSVTLQLKDDGQEKREILIALLDALQTEGIEEHHDGLIVYFKSSHYQRSQIEALLTDYQSAIQVKIVSESSIAPKNWNKEWELSYSPVVISDSCLIRAPFHKVSRKYTYEIIIEPKMSFGTGHHETTQLMMEEMLSLDFSGVRVLDAGCGTAILAILAAKMGASHIVAVDHDEWAVRNAKENILRNKVKQVEIMPGVPGQLKGQLFGVILANVNMNLLLNEMGNFSAMMQRNALLLASGIFISDGDTLENKASQCGLQKVNSRIKNDWTMIAFRKI